MMTTWHTAALTLAGDVRQLLGNLGSEIPSRFRSFRPEQWLLGLALPSMWFLFVTFVGQPGVRAH